MSTEDISNPNEKVDTTKNYRKYHKLVWVMFGIVVCFLIVGCILPGLNVYFITGIILMIITVIITISIDRYYNKKENVK